VSVFTGRPPQVSDHPGYRAGLVYGPPVSTTIATSAIVANTLYAMPIQIHRTVTIDALGARFGTGAAGAAKLGIYRSVDGNPATLVAECSTALDTSLTTVQSTGFTANPTLTPDWYWFCMCANSAPQPVASPNAVGPLMYTHYGASAFGQVVLIAPFITRLTAPLTYAGPDAFFSAAFPAITRSTGVPTTPLIEFRVAA
jgi:hypothetical protein